MTKPEITWADFAKVDMRIGTIEEAVPFEKAIKPAYKLKINFGEIGVKNSSAQLTKHYLPKDLIGKQVLAVVNFPPKQIANFMSECLVLGAVEDDSVFLIEPDTAVKNGLPIA